MNLHNKLKRHQVVQIEIDLEKLESLFSKGDLCAVDVRPLNSQSKSSLWSLCLSSCVKRLYCKAIHVEPPVTRDYKVNSLGCQSR